MIKWYHTLYTDERLEKNLNRIVKKIEQEKVTFRIYCITLASNPENMLDIIDANELLFKHYKRNEICVLGLARTRNGAVELVVKMIEEIYKKTNDVKVRKYFKREEFKVWDASLVW